MLTGLEMFDVTGSVIPVFIIVIVGILAISAGSGIYRWVRNNRQPVLSVLTTVTSKRTEVSYRHSSDSDTHRSVTRYYITFEVESGDRLEFEVQGEEYGQTAEGDLGNLTFQGTRYLGFRRHVHGYARQFPDIHRSH
ncbi:hypothetical protein AWM70_08255 [Paenibacillus yonginensis]|uniref:DUF2500 domain-containing protein n=1 Tax=Paenibacillus yonginensis TaxID=1462996 RepID=A0A1B1MZJ2_9BACL|nr:DUF2500 domain-containing protein [Paenibacillus yonginensis]ANS74579.1 hypothetical protein AWM70_08255 [Paenibacillus yonginensis]